MKNEVGVMVNLRAEGSVLKYVHDFGPKSCQLCCWNEALYTDERAATVLRALSRFAKEGQVMIFTHHRHLIDVARAALGNEALVVHTL